MMRESRGSAQPIKLLALLVIQIIYIKAPSQMPIEKGKFQMLEANKRLALELEKGEKKAHKLNLPYKMSPDCGIHEDLHSTSHKLDKEPIDVEALFKKTKAEKVLALSFDGKLCKNIKSFWRSEGIEDQNKHCQWIFRQYRCEEPNLNAVIEYHSYPPKADATVEERAVFVRIFTDDDKEVKFTYLSKCLADSDTDKRKALIHGLKCHFENSSDIDDSKQLEPEDIEARYGSLTAEQALILFCKNALFKQLAFWFLTTITLLTYSYACCVEFVCDRERLTSSRELGLLLDWNTVLPPIVNNLGKEEIENKDSTVSVA